jgi:endoglucanase
MRQLNLFKPLKYLKLLAFMMLLFILYSQKAISDNQIIELAYQSSYTPVINSFKEEITKMDDLTTKFSGSISEWNLFVYPENKSSKYFNQPTGIWLTEETVDINKIKSIMQICEGKVPVFVIYFIPTKNKPLPDDTEIQEYLNKNIQIARTIAGYKAIVIIEPDILYLETENSYTESLNRSLVKQITKIYKAFAPESRVYLDAAHSNWHPPEKVAHILKEAGIEHAEGFATNISNFQKTENELKYASKLSKLSGNKSFIIDTGRNGNGPGQSRNNAPIWSDPVGLKTGIRPTTSTNAEGLDAYLWIKPPGEADGSAFPAGSWHPELITCQE